MKMNNELGISKEVMKLVNDTEKELKDEFEKIDEVGDFNSMKVLDAFHHERVSESHFNSSTGYGYDDYGREVIEKVYARIFKAEDALVRSQFISGTHALTVCLFAMLRPGDVMLSITGKPYDTLDQVIGLEENASSLKAFGVKYMQVDLVNDDFDYDKIKETLTKNKIKLIEIQRSKGYSTRKSVSIDKVDRVIKEIRKVDQDVIIMIDNCYCEFVDKAEPTEVGADLVVGSLIKNLGGGVAPNGAYVVGNKDLINLVAERLTVPGEGKEVGPTLGMNKLILQGLFMAPSVVASALKTAVLTSKVLQKLNYNIEPAYNEKRVDIVQNIIFGNEEDLVRYCKGIQNASPIDSYASPEPSDMPGYDDKVVMAAGAFTQGSSIELSCDGPLRPPYVAYQQGGLTFNYGKIGLMSAVQRLIDKS